MKQIKCLRCPNATFKRFGVYCEVMGMPIRSDEDLNKCRGGTKVLRRADKKGKPRGKMKCKYCHKRINLSDKLFAGGKCSACSMAEEELKEEQEEKEEEKKTKGMEKNN